MGACRNQKNSQDIKPRAARSLEPGALQVPVSTEVIGLGEKMVLVQVQDDGEGKCFTGKSRSNVLQRLEEEEEFFRTIPCSQPCESSLGMAPSCCNMADDGGSGS